MIFEVYTSMPTPFRLGASESYIKTTIEEFERIDIGFGYYGILFQNPYNKAWHMGLEVCGSLIGSDKSRAKLIKRVRHDVSSGNPKIFEQQIEMGKRQMNKADFLERDEWFQKFRKEK
jgi:hypothetical protein